MDRAAASQEGTMVEPKRWRQRLWRGLTLLMAAAAGIGGAAAAESVVTYHGALARSGLYVAPALTFAKAATVQLDAGFNAMVDGAIYAQPLYWVPPAGGGSARIIVATENNFVYALDAGTGAQIWNTSLGTPVPLSTLPCGNINPMGVTGTPTIDPTTGIVYLEAFVQTSGNGPRHMVFGLSLATGAVVPGWPVDVANGLTGFNNAPQGQRSALTLVNGMLYVPYAGHFGDCGKYNGMVVGLNLAPPGVFGAWSTEITGGGSWGQSGVAFDGSSMFVTTGNTFSSTNSSWGGGEAVIRLPPTLKLTNPIGDADFFAPKNWQTLDAEDADLGGTSAIPINISTVARVLALGKDGNAYLLNRENLGGIGHAIARTQVSTVPIRTAMATYPGADAARVVFEGRGAACPNGQSGNLVMLRITPSAIATSWCASFNGGGAPIVTTTDGKTDPIVWVVGAQGDGKLYGFRGTDGKQIAAVAGGSATIEPFQTILWANGRFYVAADGAVYAFAY
jgi:hypothetical protein